MAGEGRAEAKMSPESGSQMGGGGSGRQEMHSQDPFPPFPTENEKRVSLPQIPTQ